ncbi:MAG: hypothetical protein ACREIQ_08300 [Nitrospiria bacterium]
MFNTRLSASAFLLVGMILEVLQPATLNAASQTKISEVTFTAVDYGFSGPDRIPAGMTRVRIVNKGQDLHHILLIKLEEGKTAEDFSDAMKADPSQAETGTPPAWFKYVGGPNAIIPGESGAATINLKEGNYVLTCIIPDKKGILHVALGMLKPLTVTTATGSLAPEPKAALTIDTMDFAFMPSKAITAGTHTIRANNKGTQSHEVVVVKLAPGASAKDFGAAFEPGASGPPPGKPIGGLSPMEKGGYGFFTSEFKPGNYALICFILDPASGKPHFTLGMTLDFTVKQ